VPAVNEFNEHKPKRLSKSKMNRFEKVFTVLVNLTNRFGCYAAKLIELV